MATLAMQVATPSSAKNNSLSPWQPWNANRDIDFTRFGRDLGLRETDVAALALDYIEGLDRKKTKEKGQIIPTSPGDRVGMT